MKKLKLNVEFLRVQSFDTGGVQAYGGADTKCPMCCSTVGTVKALGDTDDCASKKADTMCEPPPSGQQGCFHQFVTERSELASCDPKYPC